MTSDSGEDIRRRVEIDKLLSRASICRMRGEDRDAEDALREALAIDETRIDIRESIADMLYARGDLEAARDEYKTIVESDPKHASAEMKFGKVVLELYEREQQKHLAQEMLENPEGLATTPKHPLLAFVLSVVPGLGQIYNGERWKGVSIMGIALFCVVILISDPQGTQNLIRSTCALIAPPQTPNRAAPHVGSFVVLAASVLGFLYLYAIIDAPIVAAKTTKRKDKEPTPVAKDSEPNEWEIKSMAQSVLDEIEKESKPTHPDASPQDADQDQ